MSDAVTDDMADVSRCSTCGFAATDWDVRDTLNTARHLTDFLTLALDGSVVDAEREIAAIVGPLVAATEAYTTASQAAANHAAESHATEHERSDLDGLRQRHEAAVDRIVATLSAEDRDVNESAVDLLHRHFHGFAQLAAARHEAGDVVEMTGSVLQISASGGGVPKLAVDTADIGHRGVLGDVQAARQHHGRPWQALCLYSAERIEELNNEGHQLVPGAIGENLTITGVDWERMRSGLTMRIGEVTCVITAPAVPCAKNNRWFADGRSTRVSHDLHPGWSRWYASVLAPGTVSTGDAVALGSAPLQR